MTYVKDIIPYGFKNVDRNIERDLDPHLHFLRRQIIYQGRIKEEDIDMFINSILSDNICKHKITEGYIMKDKEKEKIVIDAERKLKPSYRLDNQKNDMAKMEKIENIRKRFLQQKREVSYEKNPRYINKEKYENIYKTLIKDFDTRDVTLNQILELSIGNLLKDILYEKIKGKKDILDIKVIKTNEYDDVMAQTDFIIQISFPGRKEYGAYDLTTSGNEKNIKNKSRLKKVICPHFNFNNRIRFEIPRSLVIINDKEFVCKYLKAYMKEIEKMGNMKPKKALEIFESIGTKSKEFKNNITNQLLRNISLN